MVEMINPNTLTKILKHKGVRDECKAILRAYKRMITDGNKVKVSYDYGKEYKKERLGRVYVKDGCGLQLFPRDVRSALASDYYWDIDTVCAQPVLLAHLCAQSNIVCETLCEYITNRKDILTDVMAHYDVSYDDAKELFNRTLYLGGENNWKRDLNRTGCSTHPFVKKFSDELWTIARVVCSENPELQQKINKVKKLDKDAKGFDTLGAVMSFTLQSLEHSVLTNMVEFFESVGRNVDVLVFDGCLVRKEPGEEEFPIELLADCAEYITERIGIDCQFTVKPLQSGLVFDDENLSDDTGDDGMIDDIYATRQFIKIMDGHIQRDGADVYVFNHSNGLWERGEDAIRGAIVRHASSLVFQEAIGKSTITHNYGGIVGKQNQIIKLLPSIMRDTQFIQNNIDTSKGKLLWANGIFDLQTGAFTEGFNSDIVFLARIPRPFPAKRNRLLEASINKALFVIPFSANINDRDPEMGRFYKNAIAYAIAGDYSHKKAYVVLGDSNCGKGVMTGALQSAFANYVATFNGKDLAYNRRSGSDSAKALGWIIDKLSSRMLIANEMEMDRGVSLNGNLIKTLSSGGDYIDVRRNYQDAQPAKITQNVFLFANDCPPITPVDSGIHTRMRYIRFTKHFVDKALEDCDENEAPADPDIKDNVKRPDWADAMFWIIYEAYAKIRGKPYWSPKCVMDETLEFIGQEQQLKAKLAERYEFGAGVDDGDYVPFKQIKDYLNEECGFNGSWSDARIGRELTLLGLPAVVKRENGKSAMCRSKIRLAE